MDNGKKAIKELFLSKFVELFWVVDVNLPLDLENLITPIISNLENERRCQIPSPQDIKAALCEMSALKAPGPYGLPEQIMEHSWG
jgi:hypothetical protein